MKPTQRLTRSVSAAVAYLDKVNNLSTRPLAKKINLPRTGGSTTVNKARFWNISKNQGIGEAWNKRSFPPSTTGLIPGASTSGLSTRIEVTATMAVFWAEVMSFSMKTQAPDAKVLRRGGIGGILSSTDWNVSFGPVRDSVCREPAAPERTYQRARHQPLLLDPEEIELRYYARQRGTQSAGCTDIHGTSLVREPAFAFHSSAKQQQETNNTTSSAAERSTFCPRSFFTADQVTEALIYHEGFSVGILSHDMQIRAVDKPKTQESQ
jgi:hypothetical protein